MGEAWWAFPLVPFFTLGLLITGNISDRERTSTRAVFEDGPQACRRGSRAPAPRSPGVRRRKEVRAWQAAFAGTGAGSGLQLDGAGGAGEQEQMDGACRTARGPPVPSRWLGPTLGQLRGRGGAGNRDGEGTPFSMTECRGGAYKGAAISVLLVRVNYLRRGRGWAGLGDSPWG